MSEGGRAADDRDRWGQELRFRPPTEADHPAVVDVLDEWFGRRMHDQLPRLWFRDFAGTSWLAETAGGRLAAFLVGFLSPGHPGDAVVYLAATDPNLRRRGVGRAMYERFFAVAASRGASRAVALVWPGDPVAIAFHRGLGFEPEGGPGTRPLYGTSAIQDYDGPGADRAFFVRPL